MAVRQKTAFAAFGSSYREHGGLLVSYSVQPYSAYAADAVSNNGNAKLLSQTLMMLRSCELLLTTVRQWQVDS